MPDPRIAPIPSAVNDHGPRVFFSRCSGSSESEISLSIDFLAKSWLARKASFNWALLLQRAMQRRGAFSMRLHALYLMTLALAGAAGQFLHFWLFAAARVVAGLLGCLFFAGC